MATPNAEQQANAATPQKRLEAIDGEIADLQKQIENLAAEGVDASQVVSKLRSLRDEREPVSRAAENWHVYQKISQHEGNAEDLAKRAEVAESQKKQWLSKLDKLNKQAADLLADYWSLAADLEDVTGMRPQSGGPTTSQPVVGAIAAVAGAAGRMNEAGYARVLRGETVKPLELEAVERIRTVVDQIPEHIRGLAHTERARAQGARKRLEGTK